MSDCLFCKIVAGEIPSEQVYSDDQVVVFKDIFPKAQVHLLVVPKAHVESLFAINDEHATLTSHIVALLPKLAKAQGLDSGFRTIVNSGKDGGQEVFHLHFHILGGKNLPGFK